MGRTTFDLMSYPVPTGYGKFRDVVTLRPVPEGRTGRLVGRVVAPDGSKIKQRGHMIEVCVPRHGRPGQYDMLNMSRAIDAAKNGKAGLSFEPEPEGAVS